MNYPNYNSEYLTELIIEKFRKSDNYENLKNNWKQIVVNNEFYMDKN